MLLLQLLSIILIVITLAIWGVIWVVKFLEKEVNTHNIYLIYYKGYIGELNWSIEDDVYYGKLKDITDLISFEGKTLKEACKDMQNAVDEYINPEV